MATAKTAAKKVAPKKKVSSDSSFAVIKTGGKQYRVMVDQTITIEKLSGDLKKGDTVSFNEVLLTDNGSTTVIGSPFIDKASVSGEIVSIGRAAKVTVLKYKQKSRYMKKNGHKQPQMKVKILSL